MKFKILGKDGYINAELWTNDIKSFNDLVNEIQEGYDYSIIENVYFLNIEEIKDYINRLKECQDLDDINDCWLFSKKDNVRNFEVVDFLNELLESHKQYSISNDCVVFFKDNQNDSK